MTEDFFAAVNRQARYVVAQAISTPEPPLECCFNAINPFLSELQGHQKSRI